MFRNLSRPGDERECGVVFSKVTFAEHALDGVHGLQRVVEHVRVVLLRLRDSLRHRQLRDYPDQQTDFFQKAKGLVWGAIVSQVDWAGSESEWVSSGDSARDVFSKHPWSVGGGGAAQLSELIEKCDGRLAAKADSIRITSFTLEDDVFVRPSDASRRRGLGDDYI